ncbi:MAG: HAMP domain-containing histidine kinase [Deltaproteobacteria bacterium]|nr:HAMP domain-containing histidine kinase [Deltaproteobacteria bacterium]MDA8305536.1 HAMP domain-containing sensor histidine kinase [Deltaproteobacteria bacterium]
MRMTIFSRVMIAQSTLILIIIAISIFAVGKLRLVSQLNTRALTVDARCISEEKLLLESFLDEMRNAEEYFLMRDLSFRDACKDNRVEFEKAVVTIRQAISSQDEKTLLSQIVSLHGEYMKQTDLADFGKNGSEAARSKLSDQIIRKITELIRLREQAASHKMATARDNAASAARVMFWLALFGIAGAFIMACINARGISRPLRQLAREMRAIGRGEFFRTARVEGPAEVIELAKSFNRMAGELEHLDRLKADFTAHVSHELRTPLTAIREGTALLLEGISGPLTKSQREILEVVRNHSQRLFQSISSILDLSKMEAEMMDYEFTMCDLKSLIGKSIEGVNLIARKMEIRLSCSVAEPIPMLRADERRIQQVFDNLLSNALKFSPAGGEVRVEAFPVQGANQCPVAVEVRVSDDGPGIPAEEIHNIFRHFYQSRHQKAKGRQGTGLGLAIARHIVEAHKGRIWAESEIGCGSTFHVVLPIGTDVSSKAEPSSLSMRAANG